MTSQTDAPRLPRYAALGPGRGGQPRLLIDAPAGYAEIALHGAHLTDWRPRGGRDVVFTSREAVFDGETAIRGGVPVILPWFAKGPDGAQRPSHGWARLMQWRVRSVEALSGGEVRALLGLEHDDLSVLMEVVVGEELRQTLSIRSVGDRPRTVEAALHTYLAVGDVTAVEVTGLENLGYDDFLAGAPMAPAGAPLRLSGPVDRLYRGAGPVEVHDPALGRRVRVEGVGAPDVVVWNPWAEGARAMRDMADDEFASMLCVESARIKDDAAVLEPGESVSVGLRLSVHDE